jgi:hypothetical protein
MPLPTACLLPAYCLPTACLLPTAYCLCLLPTAYAHFGRAYRFPLLISEAMWSA